MEIVTFLYVFSLFIIFTPKLFLNFGNKHNWIEIIVHAILFTIIVSISYNFVRSKIYEGAIIDIEFDYPTAQSLGMNQTTNVYQTFTENGLITNNDSPSISPQINIPDDTDPILVSRQTSTTPFVNFTPASLPISLENPYKFNSEDPTGDNYMDSSVITDDLRYDGFFYFMMKCPKTPSIKPVVWRQRDNPFLLDNSKITSGNGAPDFKQYLPVQSIDSSTGDDFNGLKYNGVQSILSRANRTNTLKNYEQIGTLNITASSGSLTKFAGPNGIEVTQTELYVFKPNSTFQMFIDSLTSEGQPLSVGVSPVQSSGGVSPLQSSGGVPPVQSLGGVQVNYLPEKPNKSGGEFYDFNFTKLGTFYDYIDKFPDVFRMSVDENNYTIDGCNFKCNDNRESTHFALQNTINGTSFGKCYCYNNEKNSEFASFTEDGNKCSSRNPDYGTNTCKSVYKSRQFDSNDLDNVTIDADEVNTLTTEVPSDISKISNRITNPINDAGNNRKIAFTNSITGSELTTTRIDKYNSRVNPRNPRNGWGQELQFAYLK